MVGLTMHSPTSKGFLFTTLLLNAYNTKHFLSSAASAEANWECFGVMGQNGILENVIPSSKKSPINDIFEVQE
ncbi:hypothetical protein TSUD_231700 [Trifolium subterraneum]|uniref:Uncharacterized protein n=1 Tax=Trifolium subterraneum TaxID=3900 RepID=A0A2Z6LKW2_TRISU|nr:hypothetical protein TSUD_231700 [Trifolium subterraneum]